MIASNTSTPYIHRVFPEVGSREARRNVYLDNYAAFTILVQFWQTGLFPYYWAEIMVRNAHLHYRKRKGP